MTPSDLNPAQHEAVHYTGGPLLIVAGAGSGKTRTLTERIAHMVKSGVESSRILAITFTNKAANEMKERITHIVKCETSNDLPFVGTFHSWGVRVLKREAPLLQRTQHFSIFDEDDAMRLLKTTIKTMDIDSEEFPAAMFRRRISGIKNELADIGDLAGSGHPKDKLVARVYTSYEGALQENNAFDFDDLIEKVVLLFRKYPDVLARYRDYYHHIFIDEYQDVNTSQYQLVRMLVGSRGHISVVGDDAQSIYAFRGSDFRNFLNFDKDWPDAKIIFLEENYRSTGNIIAAASAVIKNNAVQKPKHLWTAHENGSKITILGVDNADDEAEYIAEQIQELIRSSNDDPDVAILYRTNAQSRPIEYQLLKHGVPYKIYGSLRFYDRMEIKDIISTLQYALNPQHSLAAERIKKSFYKKETTILLEELPRLGVEAQIVQIIDFVLTTTKYIDYLKTCDNGIERIENVNELIAFAGTYNHLGLGAFLEQVALASAIDAPNGKSQIANSEGRADTKGVVNLMTVHAAKGLEFNQVFVAGCNEGLFPHERSLFSDDELAEERRLMYVAMTRARKELTLTFYKSASRFLYEIPPELTDFRDESINKRRSFGSFEEEDYIDYG